MIIWTKMKRMKQWEDVKNKSIIINRELKESWSLMNVLFDGNVFIESMKPNVKKQTSDELKRNRNVLKWRWKDKKLNRKQQSMSFKVVMISIDALTDEIHKQNNKDVHFINSIFPTNQKWKRKWIKRWLNNWMREWKTNQTFKSVVWSRRWNKKKWMVERKTLIQWSSSESTKSFK